MKKYSIEQLKKEFSEAQTSFNSIHDEMQSYLDGYLYNFFYKPKANMTENRVGVNLVQLFADKLWQHTSEFPKVSVPNDPNDTGDPEMREKILYSEYQKNNMDMLYTDLTFDGGVMGAAVVSTLFNVDKRCVEIRRYDPRRCYWQKSDSNNEEIEVFWTAVPRTRSAFLRKYGVAVTGSEGMVFDTLGDGEEVPIDSEEYFLDITRHDAETTAQWVGNQWIKKPYKHLQGGIPVDVAMPIKVASYNNRPFFYLSKFKDLQAEFNELWRRRGNVVRKLGNPLVYGRGVYKQNEQDVKAQLQSDGGFVPLKENGELALLTIPETKMIDTALQDCWQRMKDVAGFPTATFGEIAGANTSGDALGMYFTPTSKMVTHYNKAYKNLLQSVNAKILRSYEKFGKLKEQFSLNGYMPQGTLRSEDGKTVNKSGRGYSAKFTIDVINGNYLSIVTPASPTPKDDIAYKRFILDSVREKFISRSTGHDEIGILSPEDEMKRIEEEQSSPYLNPESADVLLKNQAGQMEGAENPMGNPMDMQNPLPQGVQDPIATEV